MDKVPLEVLSRILSYLDTRRSYNANIPNPTWPPYSTVCRKWQHQIERFSFNEVALTNDRMAEAQKILTRQRLDSCVRTIELRIRLPSYDEEARTRFENEDEKRHNNEVFTRTVGDLFSLLEPFSDCPPVDRVLKITADSRSDIWRRPDCDQTRLFRRSYLTKDICQARFQHSYLELLHAPDWPAIGVFSSFQIPDSYYRLLQRRLISPMACCQIASRLQTLTSIDWCLSDREKRDLALRAYLRDGFARGLGLLPGSLETVRLQYTYPPPNNHHFAPARVSAGTDRLSVALRALCQRVRSADVEASVTSDFFWPSAAASMEEEPGAPPEPPRPELWPHLRSIRLTAAAADPNGNWLFDRHCKYGPIDAGTGVMEEDESDEEDYIEDGEPDTPADEDRREKRFRGSPNARLLAAWNIGIARAAGGMPLLRDLHVTMGAENKSGPRPYRGDYRVTYLAVAADRRGLKIESTPVLLMDRALRDAWKEAAGDVEMELVDSVHPSSLALDEATRLYNQRLWSR